MAKAEQELVLVYSEAARRVYELLNDMLDTNSGSRKAQILAQLVRLLDGLSPETREWAEKHIREAYENAILRAAGGSTNAPNFQFDLGAVVHERAIRGLVMSFEGQLAEARRSTVQFATRLAQPTALEQSFPELGVDLRREVAVGMAEANATYDIQKRIRDRLKEQFKDGVVTVLGKNGKQYSFGLSYYAEMVAKSTRGLANTEAMINQGREMGNDLVRVSTAPALDGCYCDAFRGRVFSISGTDTRFPALSQLPNGGPPFHPHCRHNITIFIEGLYDKKQVSEYANTNPKFIMRRDEGSPNRMIREWWAATEEERRAAGTLRNV